MNSCKEDILKREEVSEINVRPTVAFRAAGDARYDLLGYGYDADKEFASANSARAKVIDVDKIMSKDPSLIEQGIIATQYGTLISGESYKEYSKSQSLKVKATASFNLFKKIFDTSFSGSSSGESFESSRYSYASYDLKIQQRRLTIYADESELFMNYLTRNFERDCQQLSAQGLVTRYGTHVLTDISLGGKLNVTYRAIINKTNKKRAAEAGISMGIAKIFNLNVKGNYSSSEAAENRNAELHFRTIGGDPSNSLIGSMGADGSVSAISIAPWQNSVTLANSQLIDIGENGLIPLYKLVPNSKKRNEVKDYIFSKIYGLKKNKDYLLNGFYYAYSLGRPGWGAFCGKVCYQIDEGLITISERSWFESYEAEKAFVNAGKVYPEDFYEINSEEKFKNHINHFYLYTQNLDLISPYLVSDRKAKDCPILVQEKQSGKY